MRRLVSRNRRDRALRTFRRLGFLIDEGGSHTHVHHEDGRFATVPRGPTIKPRLLALILKQLRITEEEYVREYR